jgi:class 3 adenylate cyclase/CHASE2 domain-containing sensor protein
LFRFGFFFYGAAVILRSRKLIPVVLCAIVLLGVMLAAFLAHNFEDFGPLRRLEWITYDWRVGEAAKREAPVAINLGLVFINDASIWYLKSGMAGYDDETRFEAGLYWPRHVYGQVVQELDKQGVDVIGFDILLGDLRPKTETVKLPGNAEEVSDSYFANQIAESGRVVLAAQNQIVPPEWFRTNAWALGDIGARREFDGVLRRSKAFEDYVVWEPILLQAKQVHDVVIDTNRVLFPQEGRTPIVIPIEPDGTFEMAKLLEVANNEKFPLGMKRKGLAFRRMRVWDLGIAMASHYLGIDLNAAEIIPGKSIQLRGTNDLRREISIDKENRFYIDWSLEAPDDPRIHHESFHSLLDRHYKRTVGKTNDLENVWRGRVALVGSSASGNDLTDVGSTPLGREAYLTMRYLNVANSMLVDRFVQQPSFALELALILALGLFSGIFTWNFRVHFAALCVILLACAYTALALYLFIESRYWMPLVIPIGGLVTVHMALVTYRVAVEQKERRRIRSIFSKIVSPNVVNELLQADALALAGVRREITVFFSDVRGFTEMTDESHARAEEHVKAHRLSVTAAEAYFDEQAHEILQTVNLYLGTIADVVKKSEGTLDKYIGDCVMAFWGAPTPNEKHAVSCVRAAIEAQRALDLLNTERAVENARRERENKERASQALPPLPPLKVLTMGAGINTGIVTLGLMGSERHVYNYTVFGRDVNLAARLEGLSGRGRILIGEATYRALLRDDPSLAGNCRELEPAAVKGFRTPVRVYEVPWHNDTAVEASPRMTQPAEAPPATAP